MIKDRIKNKLTKISRTPSKVTLENTDVDEFTKKYVNGELPNDEWSKATPSMRLACMRYARKLKKYAREETSKQNVETEVKEEETK